MVSQPSPSSSSSYLFPLMGPDGRPGGGTRQGAGDLPASPQRATTRRSGRSDASSATHTTCPDCRLASCSPLSFNLLCLFACFYYSCTQAAQRKGRAPAQGRPAGAGTNILQFYSEDSPGLQVGPTTVLIASLSFVGVVVLLHIIGKFRSG